MQPAPMKTLTIGAVAIRVRPTARAAFILYERYGVQPVLMGTLDGNISVIHDMLTLCSVHPLAGSDVRKLPLKDVMAAREDLFTFAKDLFGYADDADDGKGTDHPRESITHDEFFTRLFKIGTGWLGWAPEDTWNATAAEIMTAYEGRVDLLKAIFGGKPDNSDPTHAPDADEHRAALDVLRGLTGGRR